MLDADCHCWLLEVNTNPCLDEDSKLLKIIIPRMLDDMFKLTVDQVFPPQSESTPKGYYVPGYKNEFNMWEKISNLNAKLPVPERREMQGIFYFDGGSRVRVLGPGSLLPLEPVECLEEEDKKSYKGLRRKRRTDDLAAISDCD